MTPFEEIYKEHFSGVYLLVTLLTDGGEATPWGILSIPLVPRFSRYDGVI